MTISLARGCYRGNNRFDAELLSILRIPMSEFYLVEVEWADGERDTIMMAVEGLDKYCPDWRKFRREQMTAPRGSR